MVRRRCVVSEMLAPSVEPLDIASGEAAKANASALISTDLYNAVGTGSDGGLYISGGTTKGA